MSFEKIKTVSLNKLKGLLSRKKRQFYLKYITISLAGYIFVFTGLYLLIDLLEMNRRISFVIIYAIVYFLLYVVQLKVLFLKKHDTFKLTKYLTTILIFYISANIIYNFGLEMGLHYFLSTAVTIIILMPLRLLVYSLFVYRK